MIKAVVHTNQRNQTRAGQSSLLLSSVLCQFILFLINMLILSLFLKFCSLFAQLYICCMVRFSDVNHLQMVSINRNITAVLILPV